MKWFLTAIAIVLCCSVFVLLRVVGQFGGLGCSENWRYISDDEVTKLLASEQGGNYSNGKGVSFKFGENLVGRYDSLIFSPIKAGNGFSSRVSVNNTSNTSKKVSIEVILKSHSKSYQVQEISSFISGEKRGTTEFGTHVAAVLPPMTVGIFRFGFGKELLDSKKIEQIILLGELSPDEVLVSRELSRVRKTYNCIIGHGSGLNFELW